MGQHFEKSRQKIQENQKKMEKTNKKIENQKTIWKKRKSSQSHFCEFAWICVNLCESWIFLMWNCKKKALWICVNLCENVWNVNLCEFCFFLFFCVFLYIFWKNQQKNIKKQKNTKMRHFFRKWRKIMTIPWNFCEFLWKQILASKWHPKWPLRHSLRPKRGCSADLSVGALSVGTHQ